LRYRTRILVQDVGGSDHVNIRSRWIVIVGAKDIEDPFGIRRSGEPWRDPRFDRAPVRPNKYPRRASNDGGPDKEGEFARYRYIDGLRRGQFSVAAALGDRIAERCLRCAILAKHVAGEILNLSGFTGHAPGLKAAAEPVLVTQHTIDLLRLEAGKLLWRRPGAEQA